MIPRIVRILGVKTPANVPSLPLGAAVSGELLRGSNVLFWAKDPSIVGE